MNYLHRLSGDGMVSQTRDALTSRLVESLIRLPSQIGSGSRESLSYDNAASPRFDSHGPRHDLAGRV